MKIVYKLALCAGLAIAIGAPAPATAKTRHKRQTTTAQAQKSDATAKTPSAEAAQTEPKSAAAPATEVQAAPPPLPPPGALDVPVPPPPALTAKSWVLMDYESGQILAGNNADARVDPASITKVMTSYVVSAQLAAGKIKLDDQVFISENAWRGGGAGTDGSTSFLKLNSKVPLKDLLYGMIIQSGNDAAIALAEHAAGSEQTFAALMNQYAQKLGMAGTHYVNPSGLPAPDEYSTARDIATLSRALIRDYPQEYKIYAIKEFEWNGITQHNRNALLWRDASVDGIKTGHTKDAGFCLAASAKRGEQRLIAIVMGMGSEKERADASQAVLNYGFRFFETHKLFDANKALATPVLWEGASDTLALGTSEDVVITLPRGRYNDLKATIDMPSRIVAPIAKGRQVGMLKIALDGKSLVERPLVALADAPLGSWWRQAYDGIALWFKGNATTETQALPSAAKP